MNFPGISCLGFFLALVFCTNSNAGFLRSESMLPETTVTNWPCYMLRSETNWQLTPPNSERFDASGLFQTKTGEMWTVNDRGAGIYKINFLSAPNVADLILLTNSFTENQLASFAKEKVNRYDCEGIAMDEKGRSYLCEEANRWILRFDPKTKKVERLNIDWSPVQKYFYQRDLNASFEGIAIGNGKLFVANERQEGRIIVVDLKTLKVVDDFTVYPSRTRAKDIHYSDLCWFENSLFALLRENRVIVKINPRTHQIVAEYNYSEMEKEPDIAYHLLYPTSTMEGLAVDKNFIWLCTDNNGLGRRKSSEDRRPTLIRCLRPDK